MRGEGRLTRNLNNVAIASGAALVASEAAVASKGANDGPFTAWGWGMCAWRGRDAYPLGLGAALELQ